MRPSRLSFWSDRITSIAIATCAVAVLLSVVKREFWAGGSRQSQALDRAQPPRAIAEWPDVIAAAREPFDSTAIITVVTFVDAECPFCRRYAEALLAWKMQSRSRVSTLAVHFPLPQHRFARPAARALECAREQGRFDPMLMKLFAVQDSLGLLPWDEIAIAAGVTRRRDFRECVRSTGPIPGVEEGVTLGKRLGIAGTPAVIVNGQLYASPPDTSELSRTLKSAEKLAKRSER